jgi:hypothetical protein
MRLPQGIFQRCSINQYYSEADFINVDIPLLSGGAVGSKILFILHLKWKSSDSVMILCWLSTKNQWLTSHRIPAEDLAQNTQKAEDRFLFGDNDKAPQVPNLARGL